MEAQRQHFRGKYDLFTIYLVPGLTILLASLGNWFDTNLSVLGNTGGRRSLLMIWGWITGWYYCRYTLYLFQLGRYRGPAGKWLVAAAGAFIMSAVMIPYLPEQEPREAAIHVLLAFFSPILLAAALVVFLRFLSVRNRRYFRAAWQAMWGIAAAALLLLFAAGFINSFLELFVVIGLCGFLRHVERLLRGTQVTPRSRTLEAPGN